MARVCEALWYWVFVESGPGYLSVKRHRFDCDQQGRPFQAVEGHVLLLCAMEICYMDRFGA